MTSNNVTIKQNGGDGNNDGLGKCEGTMVDTAGRMTTTRKERG
jgi:hypothetical protein